MDRASAEREALRLWRNLPVQDRLTRAQAAAFARAIAPTIDYEQPERRPKIIEEWLEQDVPRPEAEAELMSAANVLPGKTPLPVPGWPQREGASAIAFVVALLIFIARRPDIVTNAMLWAEDGSVWFADAYDNPWWVMLLQPHAGYLQLFPRVIFELAAHLPIGVVPLFGVWLALLVRAAVPAFIFSSRFSWIDWRVKVAISAYVLLMPNLAEVHANVTNTHWYLGLYLIAVVLADPPRSRLWTVHDWLALIVAGASGPLIVFAALALLLRSWTQRRTAWARWPFAAAAVLLTVLQMVIFVLTAPGQAWLHRGADPTLFGSLLGGRVFLGFLTPARWAIALASPELMIPIVIVGAAITVAVLIRGGWRARILAALPVLLVATAQFTPLLTPLATQSTGVPLLTEQGYLVVADTAWAATLLCFAGIFLPRLTNAGLAVVLAAGGFLILFDFALPSVEGEPFGGQANRIVETPSGQTVTVPIAPPGWEMTLRKR
jgi:hypothetical protein